MDSGSGSLVMLVLLTFFIFIFTGSVLGGNKPCDTEPTCPKRQHYTENDPRCIRTCANRMVPRSRNCKPFTGCVCDPGLVRLNDDGTGPCVSEDECQPICPKRQHYTENDPRCIRTCANRMVPRSRNCKPFTGCVCDPGLVRLNDDGTGPCVSEDECQPICPKRQHYTENDPRCIRTCANRMVPRSRNCKPFTGCVCDPGLVRLNDDGTGPCVSEDKCQPTCPKRQHYTENDSRCIRTCANRMVPRSRNCKPFTGCVCDLGFVRLNDDGTGPCVSEDKCRKRCKDPNAIYKKCPNPCPLTCAHPKPRPCNKMCVKRGCECAPGFIINDINGKCIRPKDCPVPIRCPKHAHYVINDQECQKTCGNRLLPNKDTTGACKPFTGCVCNPGYVRKYDNATGPCIPKRKCPPIPTQCEVNEQPTSCRIVCPPQTCESIFTSYYCLPTECEPGCDCLDGYLRNYDDICIPSKDCFGPNDPSGCYGDVNATLVECGSSCPATCAEPDTDNEACSMDCVLNTCQCNPGYILSEPDGVCIEPEDCPGGSPICGANQTYAGCKMGCPNDFCPVDDSRAQVACSMPYPCPGGCVCNKGYLIVSRDDRRCVLASECPKIDCTRKNEVWNPKPSSCFLEKCEDIGHICQHQYPTPPRCVCKKGFYRDENDDCVPASKCPPLGCNGDRNATLKDCPSACPLTCADQDPNKPCIAICLPKGCECNPGYVLTEKGGKCIKPQDCPAQPGCNGDPNAIFSKCPSSCQATCENPDTNQPCIKMCMPSGCVCKPGYILTEKGGRCIKPETCPELGCNGDRNATLKDCPSACPLTCADQDPNKPCIKICLPKGCECNQGYVLTEKGGKCIKPQDCPGCNGDVNAMQSDCPSYCPPTCADRDKKNKNVLCPAACDPSGCVCKPGFILTEKGGRCVRPENCPETGCNGDSNAMYSECPSACQPTCAKPDNNQPCIQMCLPSGCVCKPGFVLNEENGKCVKPESCPAEPQCNGDRNATFTPCPSPCQATCDEPDTDGPCIDMCMPEGCVCKQGYLLNKTGGQCIKPGDCPGGSPTCRGNKTYVYCKVGCPNNYCPRDDSLAMFACDPIYPCPGGCACKGGYLLRSEEDDTCILSSECPPVECTRPNEIWNPDTPGCLRESCNNRNIPCDYQYPGPPRCVCIEGYYRNQDDICVPESQCPRTECDDPNATFSDCPPACPATCGDPDSDRPCIAVACAEPGCVCNEGFIMSESGGVCIRPYDCPGGSPICGANQTYAGCKIGCPNNFCPVDDSRAQVACSMPYPCPGGCVCDEGYLIVSRDDRRCILASECPKVDCTRKNEVWNPRPSSCFLERCEDRNHICEHQYPTPPRCVCKKGFYRDENDDCVPASKCPPLGCNGDRNATLKDCPSACPLTCEDQDPDKPCIAICLPKGCECNPGYVLTHEGGQCIKPQDCPVQPGCNGDSNAIFSNCPSACQATCENPDTNQPCNKMCMLSGCVCKPGYILTEKGGKCVKPETCPELGCNGDRNATLKDCPSACPLTCADQDPNKPCIAMCLRKGCECNPGYVLTENGGKCIKPQDCPGCNGDPNAMHSDCPSYCPPTCADRDKKNKSIFCPVACDPSGCVCKPGFILTEKGGRCVRPENCPETGCNGDPNAMYSECPSACQPTCAKQDTNQPCIEMCLPGGCVCKPGFVLTEENGKCIKPESCPAEPQCNGDRNATLKECPSPCQATCDEPDTDGPCIEICMPEGCVCKQGYLLNKTGGQCIQPGDCPGGSPTCRGNKTYVYCKAGCPNNYCPRDDSIYIIACPPIYPCPGGCACKEGYLMRSEEDDTCILSSECPPVECTRPNEVWNPNTPGCLHESCNNRNIPCDYQYPGPPRCVCIEGYYRNQDDICVPESQCPRTECDDPNATFSYCPSACPATCCEPDSDRPCITACAEPGCVCNEGFIMSEPGGVCIRPYDCPGGSPDCSENMTYSGCKIDCPMKYCPEDENEIMRMCDPVYPCPTGCVCKPGYLMLNTNDRTCILAADCPTVECTGPNQVWDPSPSSCNFERCDEMYYTCEDPTPGRPRCVCKEGYYKDQDGVCIPAEECPKPKCGYNEVEVPCRQICPPQNCDIAYTDYACTKESQICEPGCDCLPDHLRNGSGICIPNELCFSCQIPDERKRTCANPNPPGYEYTPPKDNMNGCDCKVGYILSELGGDCIPIDDCPTDIGCNGDPNASIKRCPYPCPSTCEAPNAFPCKRKCDPVGCACNFGYLLSNETGRCILPDKCPGGNPCGKHGRFTDCRVDCPNDYCPVDDSRGLVFCDPPEGPCLSGCICNLNHKKKSREDPRCIVSSNCPPVKCTRPNEKWSPCPSPCRAENCEDVNIQPTTCNTLVLNCEPACICKKNHFRNSSGICIPAKDCPCQIPDERKRTCANPNPPDYVYTPPKVNINGCDCKEGYILSELGGDCIPIEDCPNDIGCNGDPNASIKRCPHPCPSTCEAPNTFPCKRKCVPVGCECNSGYLLSNETGRCILPDKCPGGNPCGKHGRFVDCKEDGPNDYCPVDDSRGIVLSDPPEGPCLSGCICNLNYKKKSREDPRCIKSSNCPPVKCTRPNEKYSSCPSPCRAENCEDVNNQPTTCNTLVQNCEPACICKKNHFRNSSGICIPAKDCPCQIPDERKRTCANPNPPDYVYTPPKVNMNGCDCKEGYILSELGGDCIPIEDCPTCQIPDERKRTCANPNPPDYEYAPPEDNMNGCDCKEGYILSEIGGDCIPIEDCPTDIGCNGDPNASIKRCPHPCPSTCEAPNAFPCKRKCDPVGCECNSGYLLSNETGRCILPDKCPGGNPCGTCGYFVDCKMDCSNDYCPVDDSRDMVTCDPPADPCLSGCICKLNHKKLSREDPRCIKSSNCPPVKCTRPNEEYSSCPSPCRLENCEDKNNQPTTCNTLVENCEPACICKKNHFRNSSGICIPAKDCPC